MEPANLAKKYADHMPQAFECELNLETMKNPTMHIRCGKSYEAESIRNWVEKDHTCPNCRAHVTMDDFGTNLHLKEAMEEIPNKLLRPLEERAEKIEELRKDNDLLKKNGLQKDIEMGELRKENIDIKEANTALIGKVEVLNSTKEELIKELESSENERNKLKNDPGYLAAKEGIRELVKEMQTEFSKEIREINNAHKEEIKEIKEEFHEEIDEIKKDHEKVIAEKNQAINTRDKILGVIGIGTFGFLAYKFGNK